MRTQITNDENIQQSRDIQALTLQQANNEIESDDASTARNFAQRMSNPKLSGLRAQNPFVSLVPFPNSVINVLLGAAGTAVDINLPEGTKFINIRSTSEYFVSRNGNAQIPTAAVATNGSCSFDPSQYIYVEEIKQFSIISTGANNAICISCYQQL